MAVTNKLKKSTFKHIESELFVYRDTLKEIKILRENIIFCNNNLDKNAGGGFSGTHSAPTELITTRLLTNKKLERLEEIVNAIQKVYTGLPEDYQRLVNLRYWKQPQQYTWDGIANNLHVSKRQAMRWRDEIIYSIAEILGWR